MTYTKQTWTDSPSTSSPISAARLNHIEDGIGEAVTQNPVVSRRLSYSNGGLGTTGYSNLTNITVNTTCSYRIPIRLPCTTTQWRLKLRNYDQLNSTTKTAVTLDKIIMGDATAPSTGDIAGTGSFVGSAATTIFTGTQSIPGDGSFYTTSWVTASGDQFEEGVDHLIGIGFHTASSLAMQVGIGFCWRWTSANGTDPTVAGSAATSTSSYTPLDWVLEYETTNRKRAVLVIGDSISEGTSGPAKVLSGSNSVVPTPLCEGMWELWAANRGDVMVQRNALFASPASSWAGSSWGGWTRQDTSLGQFDAAVIELGANDIAAGTEGTNAATLKTNFISVITNLRAIVGSTVPIYVINVLPESWTTTKEADRQIFNDWLGQLPAGVDYCIDLESVVRSTSTSVMDTALTCDAIHPSYVGHAKIANVLSGAIAI
jgi:lysophospholipase L1-like esterase